MNFLRRRLIYSFKRLNYFFVRFKERYFRYRVLKFLNKHSACNKNLGMVLMWEFGGFELMFRRDAIISLALNLRGYCTHFVLCDGISSACVLREVHGKNFKEWPSSCKNCLKAMVRIAEKYGVNYSVASDYIDRNTSKKLKEIANCIDIKDIKTYCYLGIRVGEYALASFMRYKKGYPFDFFVEDNDIIYREYFYASLVNTYVANQAINKHNPLSIHTSHGLYVDFSSPVFLGVKKDIHSVCWTSGFLKNTHYYSSPKNEGTLLLRGISNLEWKKRKLKILDKKGEDRLNRFLADRYFERKTVDTKLFDKPADVSDIKKELGIDNDNPIVCLFSHVNWDGCIDFSSRVFEDSYEWVIESVKKMSKISGVNWLIKIHPWEFGLKTYYGVKDEIKRKFSCLPSNVKILESDSKINSYGIYQLIDVGITIVGTIGVELPLFGKPVIVLGEAHFSNKGFSLDMKTKEEYFWFLENVKDLKPLSSEQIKLAHQYAYSYFIERQIPLNFLNDNYEIGLGGLKGLLAGNNWIVDKICEGIVFRKDIILDEAILNTFAHKNK